MINLAHVIESFSTHCIKTHIAIMHIPTHL